MESDFCNNAGLLCGGVPSGETVDHRLDRGSDLDLTGTFCTKWKEREST